MVIVKHHQSSLRSQIFQVFHTGSWPARLSVEADEDGGGGGEDDVYDGGDDCDHCDGDGENGDDDEDGMRKRIMRDERDEKWEWWYPENDMDEDDHNYGDGSSS